MLQIVPHGGSRYLASAGLDRSYKFWDLEDLINPKNVLTKSFVTNGAWFNNWGCGILSYDDALR